MNRLIIIFLFIFSFGLAQNSDSLKLQLSNTKSDLNRCKILSILIDQEYDDSVAITHNNQLESLALLNLKKVSANKLEYEEYKNYLALSIDNKAYYAGLSEDLDKSELYTKQSFIIYKELKNYNAIANCAGALALIRYKQGYHKSALKLFQQGLELFNVIKDTSGIDVLLGNLGALYLDIGEVLKAQSCFFRVLKSVEGSGNKENRAYALMNIGHVYTQQSEYFKAIKYLNESLTLLKLIGDTQGEADLLNDLGGIYLLQKNYTKAEECFLKNYELNLKTERREKIAHALYNIASIDIVKGDYLNGLERLDKSINLFMEIDYKIGFITGKYRKAEIYFFMKKYNEAERILKECSVVANKIGHIDLIKSISAGLYNVYNVKGNYKLALEQHLIFIKMRDSLYNINTQKSIIEKETKHEFEKQKIRNDAQHLLEIKQREEKEVSDQKRNNIIIGSVCVVLFFVLIFSGILFNRFRVTKRQKLIIELKEKETLLQKHVIEEKHKEVSDSIYYAERIQRSLLGNKVLIEKYISDSFVLFQPKDVVSGDFYWCSELNNSNFALVVADSTGHGVPGAIMSMLNIACLNEAVKEGNNLPNEILNRTRKEIIEVLKRDGSKEGGKDGMDCALLCIDFDNFKLKLSAANNPVWIARYKDNEDSVESSEYNSNGYRIIEIKPDKMPVGKHDKQDIPFTLHEFDLKKGDVIYALTDGFPDQFGGEKGKKFMSKNLRELLLGNAHLPVNYQKELLEKTFANWVGDLEQIDDVTVVGIRV